MSNGMSRLVQSETMSETDTYPRLVRGTWVSSPLAHLALYANDPGDPYAAVPKSLLLAASRFRECSARQTFTSDEDGPMPPMEAVCRRQQGHDGDDRPDHARDHSNGYFSWPSSEAS